jgi:hypothetical protein
VPPGAFRQAEGPREPARQLQLDLHGAGREPPAAGVRVQAGGDQVGRRAGDGAGADDVGQEAGVARVGGLLEDQLAHVREQRLLPHRLLRHGERHRGGHVGGGERAGDGQLGEPLDQLGPHPDHGVAERAGAVGAPGEVRDGRRGRVVGCFFFIRERWGPGGGPDF